LYSHSYLGTFVLRLLYYTEPSGLTPSHLRLVSDTLACITAAKSQE
jgi:hypothetical protein